MDFLKSIFGDKAMTYAELEAALKDNKEIKLANLASGQYVDKAKFSAAETQANELKTQLEQRDKDIAEMRKANPEDLPKKFAELQTKYSDDTKALTEKLKQQTIDSKIELALTGAKAKNLTAAKALLNMGAISLDGDKVIGLDDQIKAIAKDNAFMFGEIDKNPPPPTPGAGGGVDDVSKWYKEAGLEPPTTK